MSEHNAESGGGVAVQRVVRLQSQCTTHHHACDCRERKLLAVLKPHMTELKLEGLRGNKVALQAFVDVDETWRELYGCSIEDDDRSEQPNAKYGDTHGKADRNTCRRARAKAESQAQNPYSKQQK